MRSGALAITVAVIGALAGGAQAAPITPPPGWTLDADLAPPPAAQRFGGATTKVSVYAYRAPVPGAVLYANRAEAVVSEADRDRVATTELDEPRNALRRQGATAKAELDTQRFDAGTRQLEGAVTWRDASLGVIDASRIVIAADGTRMVAVTGQCVLAIDVAPEVAKACEAALATLDPEVPRADRVVLGIVGNPSGEPPPKPASDVLDDGRGVSLPPIQVDPPRPEPDRRPVYLGGGLVVIAALFYWNRKRREKFEREHPEEAAPAAPPPGGGDEAEAAPPAKRDEDADDLHAAAEAGDDGDRT